MENTSIELDTKTRKNPMEKILERVLHPMLQPSFWRLKRKRGPLQVYSQTKVCILLKTVTVSEKQTKNTRTKNERLYGRGTSVDNLLA